MDNFFEPEPVEKWDNEKREKQLKYLDALIPEHFKQSRDADFEPLEWREWKGFEARYNLENHHYSFTPEVLAELDEEAHKKWLQNREESLLLSDGYTKLRWDESSYRFYDTKKRCDDKRRLRIPVKNKIYSPQLPFRIEPLVYKEDE